MRILILIRSWNRGGAERQCAQLVQALAERGHAVIAVSLYPGGALAGGITQTGARAVSLAKRGRFDVLGPSWRFMRLLRDTRPEVIYSFMPAANLLAVLARPAAGSATLVWGIRATRVDARAYGVLSRAMYGMQRMLINLPLLVICNSEASRREIAGLRSRGVEVVDNGIDLVRFRPDAALRDALRRELGIGSATILVGIVGRMDPMKDHDTFLTAAARLRSRMPGVRFLVAGADGSALESRLRDRARDLGLEDAVHWRALADDVETVYNGLDLLVSSSSSESFSNAIAEAMACGVPVVATDVGDSARIVGDTGCVVAPGSPEALADAMAGFLHGDRTQAGAAARARVGAAFGTDLCADRTETLLRQAAAGT